jgi:uncharacterized membrane protein
MDSVNGLAVVMRFGHVLGAVVVVGGPIFAALVIMPALRGLVDEARQAAFEAVRRRLAWLFTVGLVALIVSGAYRLISIELAEHSGQAAYHALFGVKVLLVLAVFAIGLGLLGRGKFLAGLRSRRRKWMQVHLLLVLLVVALSVVLGAISKVGG